MVSSPHQHILKDTKQTKSTTTNNDPSKQDVEAIINQLEKHEQTLQRIKLTFKKIEINIIINEFNEKKWN